MKRVLCSGCKKEIKPKTKYKMMMRTTLYGPVGMLQTPFVYHPECYKKKRRHEYYECMRPFKGSFFDIKANIASLKAPIGGLCPFNKNEFVGVFIAFIGAALFTNITFLYFLLTADPVKYASEISGFFSLLLSLNIFFGILIPIPIIPILRARRIKKILGTSSA